MTRTKTRIQLWMLVTLAGCNSGQTTSPGSDNDVLYEGRLHFESFYQASFVSYDFDSRQETPLHDGDGVDRFSVSTDGSLISVVPPSETEIQIVPVDEAGTEFTYDGQGFEFSGEIDFSPDNHSLLHEEEDFAHSDWRLIVRDTDGLVMDISHDEVRPYTGEFFDSWAWVDTESILFASGHYLFRVDDIETGEFAEIKDFSPYFIGYLDVSPDRSAIAYTKSIEDNRYEEGDVYIMDLDTGEERQLTRDSTLRSPVWSPDGQYIAFFAGEWIGGADMGWDYCPSLHIVPADLEEPVYVEYGQVPASDKVHTLKSYTPEDRLMDSCNNGQFLYWTS